MITDLLIGKNFPKKVIPLINSSRHSINIIVFDWRWYRDDPGSSIQLFNQAIIRASRRGVKVSCVLNNPVVISILSSFGCSARKLNRKSLVHVKLLLVDEDIIIIGSHNYTLSAFTQNIELSVIIRDKLKMLEFRDFFNYIYNS